MKVKSESEVAQSCPTLHNPMDCSPPGALEMNRDDSVVFEIASKYCISDSFVDYDDYVDYVGLLSTVIDIMVI